MLSKFVFLLCVSLVVPQVFGQNILDDLDESSENYDLSDLATEKIINISPSKRIFILSNQNRSFSKGDFISIILSNTIVARAIAAKVTGNHAGIKIIRIQSWSNWLRLKKGIDVKVLRGDDGQFKKKKKKKKKDKEVKIVSEDDLFNQKSIVDDNLLIDENKKRLIKQDHLIAANYAQIESLASDGSSAQYWQFVGEYAYQIADNIWLEGLYGQNVIRDYPSNLLDTTLKNFIFRAKYTISAPFYSYIQPYVGYQMVSGDSPSAGQAGSSSTVTQSELDEEITKVNNLKLSNIVFGASILKRLVPGWFFKVDLGSDIINLGFSLEF